MTAAGASQSQTVGIIGAGPAGLTAAYLLAKRGVAVTVYEADPHYVGGLARTARYKGFHFDIGGHRFFSKSKEVEELWTEILPDDLLTRPRSSRIYYRGRFFSYPLRPVEALFKLGILESTRCVLSYLRARLHPVKDPRNFEDWVSNQFGKRLFTIFFKTYTEKVWGLDCREISADWAAQRIKGLSLAAAIRNALFGRLTVRRDRARVIKTLIDSFRYPRRGPGMLWEACAEKTRAAGGAIRMGCPVVGLAFDTAVGSGRWTIEARTSDGDLIRERFDHVISSAPIKELVSWLRPAPRPAARHAAASLKYRDFLTVVLILEDRDRFSDNWIYIHEPGVKVGRIQNFKSWSPDMIPDPSLCCYGLEYFCFAGDGLWRAPDQELIELGKSEIDRIGLARAGEVLDGCVVRQAKAYPVYDDQYAAHVETVRNELSSAYPGLHLVGRNGMHKYNNQDHAMMTAMLCVENILAGEQVFDLWAVNQDAEYHESGEVGSRRLVGDSRLVPRRVSS
ncbi:MAG TPA: NAD(P)/FAD-dependent oxidoreductase [Methylomirabilota bacterium]|jgi:protoporphyrinogen oxidase|nr:NAD(P)/FAD-dependent oxidoreductase [Methylomirabilota bacterium]